MRKYIYITAVVFSACTQNGEWQQLAKSCDSLCGSLAEVRREFVSPDTIIFRNMAGEFARYSDFVTNRTDTVEKSEADVLRVYYQAGRDLQASIQNRRKVSEALTVSITQLGKLADDARNHAGSAKGLSEALANERKRAAEVMAAARSQKILASAAAESLRGYRHAVEAIIRKYNDGELPNFSVEAVQAGIRPAL
jgi:hypothetical protein